LGYISSVKKAHIYKKIRKLSQPWISLFSLDLEALKQLRRYSFYAHMLFK